MTELLSGYDINTRELIFRVYAAPIPETERGRRHKISHLVALDLLGAALLRDFHIRHAMIKRIGLQKPQLIHENLYMNISHCSGLAVAAVGYVPLGVDAETPRAYKERFLPRICAPDEVSAIMQAEDADKNLVFSRFWTLKEAYAKYTGKGIGMKFSELGFTLGDEIHFHHPDAENVQFYQLLLQKIYVVSLCVPRGDYRTIELSRQRMTGS